MITIHNIKSALRNSILFTTSTPQNTAINQLSALFKHQKRSFFYFWRKYLADSLYCHASPGVLETIILELGDGTGKKLLNLGGGSGQVSKIFESLGFDVYNIDLIVEEENEHNRKLDLNKDKLPFSDNFFDVVVAQEIIEHLENPWNMLRVSKNALKPAGKLIISTPNILSFHSRVRFLFTGYFPWFTPSCFEYHVNPIPFWQLDLIAKQTGLTIEKVQGNGEYFFGASKNVKGTLFKNEEIIVTLK